MKNNKKIVISAALALVLLMALLSGCGIVKTPAESAEPATAAEPVVVVDPAAAPEIQVETGRQDGERFEATIMLEGMEETVQYEHVRNAALGFEMDYEYESLTRRTEPGRECFVSVWDQPEDPWNYLEVSFRAGDVDAVSASVKAALSQDYELLEDSRDLEHAGSCRYIEAAVIKGTNNMADKIQMVYIIPAGDGCIVATAHCAAEAAEGFGRRFNYMLNTLSIIGRKAETGLTGTWQTASIGYEDGDTMAPEFYVQFTDTDIVYGHMKDGEFVVDHSDKITSLEALAGGGYRVQAEASNGVRYTYQTCDTDPDVLEYYETWAEEDFAEAYRGGASLSRCA